MSVSPVHPDPNCPDCHGDGRVRFDASSDPIVPCGRCKARECAWCDAVLPYHEARCKRKTTPYSPVDAAVMAERDACASVADAEASGVDAREAAENPHHEKEVATWWDGYRAGAEAVAASIRTRGAHG